MGDTMYMPGPAVELLAGANPSASEVDEVCKSLSSRVALLHCALEDKRVYGADPGGPLGLQAWKLRWEGGLEEYVARTPWWRDRLSECVSC
jgi:hypothetical protein